MQLPAATTLPARAARLIVLAILVGIGISHIGFAIREWPLHDMDVYLAAAERLRDGQPLYVAGDVAVNSFWYAPWYAVLWVPLTYLPRELVAIAWSTLLIAATGTVVLLLARRGGWGVILTLLVGPPLFAVSAGGNIQPVMVLALLVGFNRSWGPVAVAAAASMKFTPILLAGAYVARREWWKAAASLGVSAVLLIPSFLMGITEAGVRSGAAPSLIGISPVIYAATLAGAILCIFLVPRRHALLAAASAAVLALPRLFVYDVTLIATGTALTDRVIADPAASTDAISPPLPNR